MLTALSMLISLSGCATLDRLLRATRVQAQAELVPQALEVNRPLPDMPADCPAREISGVKVGDRLDVALIKTDAALSRANAKLGRCAGWYGDLQKSRVQ